MDKGTALLLATGIPVTMIRLLPWYEGQHAQRIGTESITATDQITARAAAHRTGQP